MLSEDDVRALAEDVLELLGPDIDLQLDPYGDAGDLGWLVWPLIDGHRSFGIPVLRTMTVAEAVGQLLEMTNEYVGETDRFWGLAFPPCPGHRHPARIEVDDRPDGALVTLTCPETDEPVSRTEFEL